MGAGGGLACAVSGAMTSASSAKHWMGRKRKQESKAEEARPAEGAPLSETPAPTGLAAVGSDLGRAGCRGAVGVMEMAQQVEKFAGKPSPHLEPMR